MKVVYPGSFDPITNGHLDIIEKASKKFEIVVVAVLVNVNKKSTFTLMEKIDMINKATKHLKNVQIVSFNGALVDLAKTVGSETIIKGLRTATDFEYELGMAIANNIIEPSIETIFMITQLKYQFISSSIVREVARLGKNLEPFVPLEIIEDISEKFRK